MYDLIVVVAPQNAGWILDKMANVIVKAATKLGLSAIKLYDIGKFPNAKHVFSMHYSLAAYISVMNKHIPEHSTFFTHQSVPIKQVINFLKKCSKVVVGNFVGFNMLKDAGVDELKIKVVPEGSDPVMFQPHRRKEGKVLISSAYYERKNSGLLLKIIKEMPEKSFKIIGKQWDESPDYTELASQPNLEILLNEPYENYPKLYEDCDVYLSCATLEGCGPNGLIEGMMSNMVPVVSDTGNARELITHGYNGFIFGMDTPLEVIKNCINIASTMEVDVRKTVENFTWDLFGREIIEFLFPHLISDDWKEEG